MHVSGAQPPTTAVSDNLFTVITHKLFNASGKRPKVQDIKLFDHETVTYWAPCLSGTLQNDTIWWGIEFLHLLVLHKNVRKFLVLEMR